MAPPRRPRSAGGWGAMRAPPGAGVYSAERPFAGDEEAASVWSLPCRLRREHLTLRSQTMVASGAMVALSCIVSITLSLVIVYTLGASVFQDSMSTISSQTRSNTKELARELANTIGQQLGMVGNSINKVSALYSRILLTSTNRDAATPPFQRLAPFPSYAEFNFVSECASINLCPSDFGPLSPRSRLPVPCNGSMAHSSTYLFSTALDGAIKTPTTWNATLASSRVLSDVVNAMAVQDSDMRVMYAADSTTAMLMLAAKVSDADSDQYISILRSFPGMSIASTSYDPANRPWFVGPGVGSRLYHLYGPYLETFTGQQVVTLSYKESFSYMDQQVEVVSAAAVLLDSLRRLVSSIEYTNGGFAVVFRKKTQEVLVWGDRTDVVDQASGKFLRMQDLEPRLPASVCAAASFEYEDEGGMRWLGACADALFAQFSVSRAFVDPLGEALTVVVFTSLAEAELPGSDLRRRVDDAASLITMVVLVLVLGVSGVVYWMVFCLVTRLTQPLKAIREVAGDVIGIMAEDEESRDFSEVLYKSLALLSREDEVGALAADMFHLLCLLHNKVIAKRASPQYPLNPWMLPREEDALVRRSILSWRDLQDVHAWPASPLNTDSLSPATAQPEALSTMSMHSMSILTKLELPVRSSTTLAQPIRWFASLKTRVSALAILLMIGVVGAMVVCVAVLKVNGTAWSDEISERVAAKELTSLESIVAVRTMFVKSVFAEMGTNLRGGAEFFASLMAGNLTERSWLSDGAYLPSWSIDPANPYSLPTYRVSDLFSGYFAAADAQCASAAPPTCATVHDSEETKLTSLLDIKMESFFHPTSNLSFVQVALETTGLTRYWPYRNTSTNSAPASCLLQSLTAPLCADLMARSKCGNASAAAFPAYEARCRDWYELAREHDEIAGLPLFQRPRQASDGSYVLTGVIRAVDPLSGVTYGVLNQNFKAAALATTINTEPILASGYSFLVDALDVDAVILHLRASNECSSVQCAEGMSAAEYAKFKDAAFKGAALRTDNRAPTTYWKGGETWWVTTRPVRSGSVDYVLVGTVPTAEVLKSASSVERAIDRVATSMLIGYSVAVTIFVGFLVWGIQRTVHFVLSPIDDLRRVLQCALRDDFSQELPVHTSSADVAELLKAISQLLVALRFGSDSLVRGNSRDAYSVFEAALWLFSSTGNLKGMGTCLNNMAAVELALGNNSAAENLFNRAIWNAEGQLEMVQAQLDRAGVEVPALLQELRRARRVLSDRKSNLAVVYMEQGEACAAFATLEALLEEDKRSMHLRGCIAKQGTLGRYFLRQADLESAERVFTSALAFVREREARRFDFPVDAAEADACEMLALFNMACLAEARLKGSGAEELAAVERRYLEALMAPAHMDVSTVRRIFKSLAALYGRHPELAEAKALVDRIAAERGWRLASQSEEVAACKRVVFAIDYSGSMAGTKICSAVQNLHAIVRDHVRSGDAVAILSFNDSVRENLPLTAKAGHEAAIQAKIDSLVGPYGGTAFYDAVMCALQILRADPGPNDWIVALTDGEDNTSSVAVDELVQELAASRVSVITVAVGSEAAEDVLQHLAQATARGSSIVASADRRGIDEAFGEIARILQTQVVLEDL